MLQNIYIYAEDDPRHQMRQRVAKLVGATRLMGTTSWIQGYLAHKKTPRPRTLQ